MEGLVEARVELIKYEAARRALAEAHRVDEVKRIRNKAVALEAYSRQAKDRDMEMWCAEIRLRAERRAGELLAEMDNHPPGPDRKDVSTATTYPPKLADLGISRDESSKWQKLALVPEEEFETKIHEAISAQQLGIKGFLRTAFSSREMEWNTPPDIIERVVAVLREIDLDPCADAGKSIPAKKHFTLEDDGLAQEWVGRIYMNPPYGDEIGQWVEKLHTESGVTQAIALVPARTDTAWFRRFHLHEDTPVCFIAGRLKFSGHQNSAPFPSAVLYLGGNQRSFAEHFGPIGNIFMPAYDWLIEGEDEDEAQLGKSLS